MKQPPPKQRLPVKRDLALHNYDKEEALLWQWRQLGFKIESLHGEIFKLAGQRSQLKIQLQSMLNSGHPVLRATCGGKLTDRPKEVAALIIANPGITNKELAHAMGISVRTVKFHISLVYRAYGVRNREALLIYLAELKGVQNEKDTNSVVPISQCR